MKPRRRRIVVIGSAVAGVAAITAAVVLVRRTRPRRKPDLPAVGGYVVPGQSSSPPKPSTTGVDSQAPTYTPDDVVHVAEGSLHFPAQGSASGEVPLLDLDIHANGTLHTDIVVRVYPSAANDAFGGKSLCSTFSRVTTVAAGAVKSTIGKTGYDFCPQGTVPLAQGTTIDQIGVVQHGREVAVRMEAQGGLVKASGPIDFEELGNAIEQGWGAREAYTAELEVRWRWDDA